MSAIKTEIEADRRAGGNAVEQGEEAEAEKWVMLSQAKETRN